VDGHSEKTDFHRLLLEFSEVYYNYSRKKPKVQLCYLLIEHKIFFSSKIRNIFYKQLAYRLGLIFVVILFSLTLGVFEFTLKIRKVLQNFYDFDTNKRIRITYNPSELSREFSAQIDCGMCVFKNSSVMA
tara:strand:+ start:1107 stop:1496 length:390 start_codon:yes stop_codon:yes gene_type:complete